MDLSGNFKLYYLFDCFLYNLRLVYLQKYIEIDRNSHFSYQKKRNNVVKVTVYIKHDDDIFTIHRT